MKIFKKHFYIIGEKPQTDWRRVLFVATALSIVVSLYGIIFYHRILAENQNFEEPVVVKEIVNATSTISAEETGGKLELNQTIELYFQKKANFEKMVNELKKSQY